MRGKKRRGRAICDAHQSLLSSSGSVRQIAIAIGFGRACLRVAKSTEGGRPQGYRKRPQTATVTGTNRRRMRSMSNLAVPSVIRSRPSLAVASCMRQNNVDFMHDPAPAPAHLHLDTHLYLYSSTKVRVARHGYCLPSPSCPILLSQSMPCGVCAFSYVSPVELPRSCPALPLIPADRLRVIVLRELRRGLR